MASYFCYLQWHVLLIFCRNKQPVNEKNYYQEDMHQMLVICVYMNICVNVIVLSCVCVCVHMY